MEVSKLVKMGKYFVLIVKKNKNKQSSLDNIFAAQWNLKATLRK